MNDDFQLRASDGSWPQNWTAKSDGERPAVMQKTDGDEPVVMSTDDLKLVVSATDGEKPAVATSDESRPTSTKLPSEADVAKPAVKSTDGEKPAVATDDVMKCDGSRLQRSRQHAMKTMCGPPPPSRRCVVARETCPPTTFDGFPQRSRLALDVEAPVVLTDGSRPPTRQRLP